MKSEKLGQLRAGKEERNATFESRHDTFRDEMHQDSCFHEPCNEGDERDQQRRAGREGTETRRITAGNLAKRRADNESDCGSNRNDSVARTAKNPEDQPAEKTGIKACFRRQICERCIA